MVCTASQEDYQKVNCGRDQKECTMCCIFHVCEHNWESRDVWRTCDHFLAGSCSFKG